MSAIKELKILRVFLSESDKYEGKIIYETMLVKARDAGLIGATVIRGIAGYGFLHEIHSAKLFEMSQSLPVIVEIIDTKENLDKILPYIMEVAPQKLITLQDISILKP